MRNSYKNTDKTYIQNVYESLCNTIRPLRVDLRFNQDSFQLSSKALQDIFKSSIETDRLLFYPRTTLIYTSTYLCNLFRVLYVHVLVFKNSHEEMFKHLRVACLRNVFSLGIYIILNIYFLVWIGIMYIDGRKWNGCIPETGLLINTTSMHLIRKFW